MFWASYLLAVLAIVLAWPVPILLSRAKWPARSPFTAMILWQAIALAGGLSMIGAMLVYGLEPIGDNLIAGLRALAGMVLFNACSRTACLSDPETIPAVGSIPIERASLRRSVTLAASSTALPPII